MKKTFLGKTDFIEDDDDVGDGDVDDDDYHRHHHPNRHDHIDDDEADKPAATVATKPMPHCPHE